MDEFGVDRSLVRSAGTQRRGERGARSVPHIEALTGLRFIAAAIVLVEHFPQIVPGVSDHRLAQGGAGVSMFFVLSGFVLVLNYGDDFAGRPTRRVLWHYAVARFARLVPLHLFALGVVGAIVLWRNDLISVYGPPSTLVGFVANATLLHAWVPAKAMVLWNEPSWSISAEAFFYVCLPLLVPLVVWPAMRRLWLGRAIVVVIVTQIIVYVTVSWIAGEVMLGRGSGVEASRLIVVRLARVPGLRIGEFVVGCLLAAAFRPGYRTVARGGWTLLENERSRRWLLGVAIGAGIAIQFLPSCVGDACGPEAATAIAFVDFKIFAVYVPVVTVIVAAVAWGHGSTQRFLRHPILVRLGEASYALYIIQWAAWLVVNDRAVGPPTFVHAAAAIGAAIAMALVLHRFVEKPARRWILERFGRPMPQSESQLA